MRQPCELFVVDRLLPTLRGEVARVLHRGGMAEEDIARRLGVTQASVSHYVRERRGEGELREALPHLSAFASALATELAEGTEGRMRAALVCSACGALRSRGRLDRENLRATGMAAEEAWELAPGWRGLAPPAWTGQPCELVAAHLLPLLRRRTAVLLRDEHGLTQEDIAQRLNVSQALVSRYLRSEARRDLDAQFPELGNRAGLLANLLASGMPTPSSVAAVCSLCTVAWTRGSGCRCPNVYPFLRPLVALEAELG